MVLITIDPVSAYLPARVDPWKGTHVRRALEPVRRLAGELRVAVVMVQHLNRRSDTTDPLARISDSQGLPQVARSVLVWPETRTREVRKVLTGRKLNLARRPRSASFEIREFRRTAKVVHLGESDSRAEDVVADSETRTQTVCA